MAKLRFVVVKGLNGWGDRLQCTLQAIRYAKTTGRHIVLDWRDEDWATVDGPSLDYYVDLHGLRHFRLAEFLDYFAAYEDSLTVTPEGWRHVVTKIPDRDFLYGPVYYIDGGQEQIDQIATHKRADFPHDVVVYSSVGYRGFRYGDFDHIHPAKWVRDGFTRFAADVGLTHKGFDIVHLRGGSKKWAGGSAGGLADLDKKIHGTFPTLESYLTHMDAEYTKAIAGKPALPMYVLSDSAWLADQWVQQIGKGSPISQGYAGPMFNTGIFQIPEAELAKHGMSKVQINYEMLRDFAIMMNARQVLTDGVSLFSKMANNCADAATAWRF